MVRQSDNAIKERVYYALEVELISPLSIYVGKKGNRYTARDVIRNNAGVVFVPGTSIAGAFRAYLSRKDNDSAEAFFGVGDEKWSKKEGRMSAFYVSDLFFDKCEIVHRKHLGARTQGSRKVKTDVEVVETGATGVVFFDYVSRDEESQILFEAVVNQILYGIEREEIRFGNNTTRGYGHFRINKIYRKSFSPEKGNVEEWMNFLDARGTEEQLNAYGEGIAYDKWLEENVDLTSVYSQFVKLQIPLKTDGGVSIRKNIIEPDRPESEPLKSNDKLVIPGRTWAGAIREHTARLLEGLGCEAKHVQQICEEWFGSPWTGKSQVSFSESIMEGATEILSSKGKIDRFTGTSIKRSGFQEVVCCGGSTKLEMMVNRKYKNYKALLGMMYLIIEEVQKGYLPIGGQTAIGKGVFQENGDIIVDTGNEPEVISKEVCLAELVLFLQEEKNERKDSYRQFKKNR